MLRHIAGHGRAPGQRGPEQFEQCFSHCDVLIIGAGPAGLAAARRLASTDLRVVVVDECERPGGWLLKENTSIDGSNGTDWCDRITRQLSAAENVTLLYLTTAFGFYDHNLVALAERLPSGAATFSQRLHRVRAKQVVFATGSIERPLVFANNDLPGIMLAGAARAYLNQFAAKVGQRMVIYTNNDSAYRSAVDLSDAGVDVAAVADLREAPHASAIARLSERGISLYKGARIAAHGRRHLRSVRLCHSGSEQALQLDCDTLAVSGGWTPTLHLHSQSGGAVRFEPQLDTFVPGTPKQATVAAGAVNGLHGLQECLDDGERAAVTIAKRFGLVTGAPNGRSIDPSNESVENQLLFDTDCPAVKVVNQHKARRRGIGASGKYFVDFQNDVTISDVRQAYRESYVSVEHLKRYTTLGMGTDQGKTSNLNGLDLLAGLREEPVPKVGITTFRPPYTPVTLGLLAGQSQGAHLSPTRKTVLHAKHEQAGAVFDFNGLWLRPRCYLRHGETEETAIGREIRAVREGVGMTDVSTLGKFEIQGADCAEFLNRVYIGNMDTLVSGRCRYGLMLSDDGMVLDDGTVTRLDQQHYFITTSTGHAEHVLQHLEFLLDVLWPELDVNLVAVTEQWAGVAVAGPASRKLLRQLADSDTEVLESVPYMGYASIELEESGQCIKARLLRISYSGEMAYEIYVPAHSATHVWELILNHGPGFDLQPYGMDAMDVLRIEKGFIVVGADADGRTTPMDIGMGAMLSKTKHFIGRHALTRPAMHESGRFQLVGLQAVNYQDGLFEGAQLTRLAGDRGYGASIGHISSAGFSPLLQRHVALALVRDGRKHLGQTIYSQDPARACPTPVGVTIVEPCAYDPEGARLRR